MSFQMPTNKELNHLLDQLTEKDKKQIYSEYLNDAFQEDLSRMINLQPSSFLYEKEMPLKTESSSNKTDHLTTNNDFEDKIKINSDELNKNSSIGNMKLTDIKIMQAA